jgi:hypothetical protein
MDAQGNGSPKSWLGAATNPRSELSCQHGYRGSKMGKISPEVAVLVLLVAPLSIVFVLDECEDLY